MIKGKLSSFFEPNSIVIIGASATPGKSGNIVIRNIMANGYMGKLFLVNPKGGEILGIPVHPSIASLPKGIDLAIIVLPAKETPQALRECAEKGIRHSVLSAGGFAEVDEYGMEIQRELTTIIREKGIRVLGPILRATLQPPISSHPPFSPGRSVVGRSPILDKLVILPLTQ